VCVCVCVCVCVYLCVSVCVFVYRHIGPVENTLFQVPLTKPSLKALITTRLTALLGQH
jgi:hypothetical protein